jgi:hypothetical protein
LLSAFTPSLRWTLIQTSEFTFSINTVVYTIISFPLCLVLFL